MLTASEDLSDASDEPPAAVVLVLSGWSDGPLEHLSYACRHIRFEPVPVPTPPVGVRWLWNPFVALILALVGGIGPLCDFAGSTVPSAAAAAKLAVVALAMLAGRLLVAGVVRFAVWRGVEETRASIAALAPAAIVGFSWGGGVAWELLARDAWRGPTLLLAPTVQAMAAVALSSPPWPTLRDGTSVDVVTPEHDPFCPPSQARLFAACGCRCHEVADEHPMLRAATAEEVAALLRRVVPPPRES